MSEFTVRDGVAWLGVEWDGPYVDLELLAHNRRRKVWIESKLIEMKETV